VTHRLAIVATHPIQYYAPWFRFIAERGDFELKVFYLWKPQAALDPGFGRVVEWDVPLLDGYDHAFVANAAGDPGTHHFNGLINPGLSDALAAWRPDAVLLMAYNYRSLMPLIMGWRKTPILFRGDSHRLVSASGPICWLKELGIAGFFRRFSACLYVGEANREYFTRHGVTEDRLFFSPHCVDNARFAAGRGLGREKREELGIGPDEAVVLFAGKFQPKKRPDLLLSAFQRLNTSAHLILLGNGEMEPMLRERAHGSGRIHFLPFQNQSAMPAWLDACDVLVLPSEGPAETWGLIINEVQNLAKPVIVSDHVGCWKDLVAARDSEPPGIVFPAGNEAKLAEALQTLLADPARRRTMGDAGARRVARYTMQAAADGLVEAVRSVTR